MMVDNIEQTGSSSLDNQDLIYLLENIKQGEASAIIESDLPYESDISELDDENNEQITDFQFNDYEITVLKEG